MTGDIPSNYDDKRLPILDLKVRIGEIQPGIHKIITTYYMKDASTRAVINCRSSHPYQMKMNVMVNEVLRILRNCNEYCRWNEEADHITYFMKRLQFSGYDHRFRFEVVKRALKKHERTKEGKEGKDMKENGKKGNYWYKNDSKTKAVIFVQATEDGRLKEEIQQCAIRNKLEMKIIEKVENSIQKELQKSNPFKTQTCGKTTCKICEIETGVNCRARSCVYEMECGICQRKYRGQTGNSAQERINQHFTDWSRKDHTCPLQRLR